MNTKPLIAINALSVVGNGCMAVQPIVVGALVDLLGFSEAQAGFVASMEMTGVGVGFLLLLGVAQRFPRWLLAGAGIVTIVGANVAACFIHRFEPMLLAQFIVGLGSSMVFSVYLTVGASQPQPEKLFAIVNAVSIAYSGLFMPVAPGILAGWRLPGIFLTLAGIALLSSVLLPWLPTSTPAGAVSASSFRAAASPAKLLNGRVAMVLAMMLLLYTGHGAIWAYQERIGVSLGMSVNTVGKWLGTSMLIWGVIGSMLAGWLGMRFGRIWPQVLSLGVSVVAALILVFGTSMFLFALACGLIALSWFYGLPYQMGLLSQYDRMGRLNMAGCTMTTGGAALGPALAALLVGSSGHWPVGVLAGCCYLTGLILVIPPSLDRSRVVALALDA